MVSQMSTSCARKNPPRNDGSHRNLAGRTCVRTAIATGASMSANAVWSRSPVMRFATHSFPPKVRKNGREKSKVKRLVSRTSA
jgi:hypothetical protein